MYGGGTIGAGVYDLIMERLGGNSISNPALRQPNKPPCVIKKICLRDLNKNHQFHINSTETELVTDFNSILDDEEIDLVVEVMGGTGLAKTVVLESLRRGKSVVTANSFLVAENLNEIHEVLLSNRKVTFAYEGAVCGGIPIIQTMQTCFSGDAIQEIMVRRSSKVKSKFLKRGLTISSYQMVF